MSSLTKTCFWLSFAVILFVMSFGLYALLLCVFILAFISGGVTSAYLLSKETSSLYPCQSLVTFGHPNYPGIEKVKELMEPNTNIKNFDKRMTGASVIDDVLKEVLEYTVRDYIKTWYRQISDHDGFLVDIWQCAQKVVITCSKRSKEIDWMPYFTQKLVDDFATHIRLYRRAEEKTFQVKNEDNGAALENTFFDMEAEMENNMCRDSVCLDPAAERQYLRDLSDILLFMLLPVEDFQNRPFHYFVREILVNGIFLPVVDLLSDPDYINQYIIRLCSEGSFTCETFLTVIRSSNSIDELKAVKDKVDGDIAKWRSKDTGGSDDTSIKQNLNSLLFLHDTCEMRIKCLLEGSVSSEPVTDEPESIQYQGLYTLSLDEIFNSAAALQSFFEYLSSRGVQQYLFFYLNVEGFRAAAETQISEMQKHSQDSEIKMKPDLESLRKAAKIIFNQYLSEKATSRLKVEPDLIKLTVQKFKQKMLSEDIFDAVQARVRQILHSKYYEDFLQSSTYKKLLGDLGLMSIEGDISSIESDASVAAASSKCSLDSAEEAMEPHNEDNDLDTLSMDSCSPVASVSSSLGEAYLCAQVARSGTAKGSDKSGKPYAVFGITVRKKEPQGTEQVWEVHRRYSDFYDLHKILLHKFPELTLPPLPSKTVLRNTSPSFLEKRRKDLDKYLKALMKPELYQHVNGLEELLYQFLYSGVWDSEEPELLEKFDQVRTQEMNQLKVSAGLDREAGENIPLRIMLLLMEEVFDLRHKHQWLRRRIVMILREFIKATFGDTINRKIVEHVDLLTSAEQMAEYVTAFRNSFWPNGVLAEACAPRDEPAKMRTRVLCKAKMLGSVPDEVCTMMGTDAVRKGAARVFNMLQYKTLNKRILYVVLEGVLVTLFPDNKFQALFHRLHSRSARVGKLQKQQKPGFLHNPQNLNVNVPYGVAFQKRPVSSALNMFQGL